MSSGTLACSGSPYLINRKRQENLVGEDSMKVDPQGVRRTASC